MFSSQRTFEGLNNTLSNSAGITPAEMITSTAGEIVNGFGGKVEVLAVKHNGGDNQGYVIAFDSIPKAACVTMATTDWGGDVGSGFAGMVVVGAAATAGTAANAVASVSKDTLTAAQNLAIPGDGTYNTPMSIVNAQASCANAANNAMALKYI
jgi:hypothetical protein